MLEKVLALVSGRGRGVHGASLANAESRDSALKFDKLVAGEVSVEELGDPRFQRAADGTPRLVVDHQTFLALLESSAS